LRKDKHEKASNNLALCVFLLCFFLDIHGA